MDWEILYSIMVAGGWDKLASWALWGFMPTSKCESLIIKCLKCHSDGNFYKRRAMTLDPRMATMKNMVQLLTLALAAQRLDIMTTMGIQS